MLIRTPIRATIIWVIAGLLGFPGISHAHGLPTGIGVGIILVPMLIFLPVVVILLVLAYQLEGGTGWRQGLRRVCIAAVAIYVVFFGRFYPEDMGPNGFSGTEALQISGILFGTIIGIWLSVLAPGRGRRMAIGATAGAFVVANLLTPTVISFRYYESVDNPLPEPDGTIRSFTDYDAQLGDGRYLRFDTSLYLSGNPMPVFINEVSPGQVRISVARDKRIPRSLKPMVDLRWIKVQEDLHEIEALGTGRVLEDGWIPSPDAAASVASHGQAGCQPEYVAEILRRGADPNANILGTSALHYAAKNRCPEAITHLLAAGADINATDSSGRTPLRLAAFEVETLPVIELLIEAGADVSIEDQNGWNALDVARGRFGPGGSEAWRPGSEVIAALEAAADRQSVNATAGQ